MKGAVWDRRASLVEVLQDFGEGRAAQTSETAPSCVTTATAKGQKPGTASSDRWA